MGGRFVRIGGHLLILFLSFVGILLYQMEKDIRNSDLPSSLKKFLTYPTNLENRFYDLRMPLKSAKELSQSPLVLASIDEQSLKTIGRWPWSREVWANLVKKFEQFGVRVVAMDVVLSEKEKSCKTTGETPDILLANAVKEFTQKGGKVIFPYSLVSMNPADNEVAFDSTPSELYEFMMDSTQQGEASLLPYRVMSTTFPIPELLSSGAMLAFIGAQEDSDGIFRRYPLTANLETMLYPSLALLSFMAYTETKPRVEIDRFGNGELIVNQKKSLELSHEGETLIRWSGGPSFFNEVSLATLWKANGDEKELLQLLKGKLVYVGSTAYAAHDLRHTPIDAKLPGVFFHINMSQMLIDNYFYQKLVQSLEFSWIVLLLGWGLIIAISLFKSAIGDIFAIIFASLFLLVLDRYWFTPEGYRITLFFIYVGLIGASLWNVFLNFYLANKDKQFLKAAFGNYISPELIEMMHKNGEQPRLGGESAIMTAFFTDIQGFSTFSEKLRPTQLVELLNEYLTAMTDILLEEKGTLDKYEGDAIIAFFGAPVRLEDHAIRAARVALKMQEKLSLLREKWKGEGERWPTIVHDMRMRIGLNSGEMVVGNMGSRSRMNYTMMGDAVNLAARLEAAAKQYGIFIHASEAVKELTGDHFAWRELDLVRVVGKSVPVRTYELLGEKVTLDLKLKELQDLFHEALKFYRNQKWEKAKSLFHEAISLEMKRFDSKKNPSQLYCERCDEFIKNPPPVDWDGVAVLTSK